MNRELELMVWEKAYSTDFLQSEPMTFIRLTYKPPKRGKWLFGIGFARCMDTDEWSADIGHKIAFGRAVKQIVEQLENHGHRVVVNRGGTVVVTNCNVRQDAACKLPAIEIRSAEDYR